MNKYEIILDVYDTKSISRTAEKLSYTQSAISQTIKAYENEIGLKLFNRSKKGMEPRLEAEEIFSALRNICAEEKVITEVAQSLSDLESGDIRIGTIQSISYSWLPDILSQFSSDYPNIKFTLTVDGFSQLNKKLLSGELDCIFTSEYASPGLSFMPLYRDELMLVIDQSHKLSGKMTVSIEDVKGQQFILPSDGLEYEAGEIFRMNEIVPDIRYKLNDDFTVANLIANGYGVSILSNLLLRHIPFDVCIRPFNAHYYRTLGVAWQDSDRKSKALLQFLESVDEWYKSK